MNTDKLNRWLTLAANLGVLAGLGLLILELGQTREMMRAETRSGIAVMAVDLLRDPSINPQLAQVMNREYAGEELQNWERSQFNFRTLAMFRHFENVSYQYRQELYDESEFETQREAWRRFMGNASHRRVWCDWHDTFAVEFRNMLDQLLAQPCT